MAGTETDWRFALSDSIWLVRKQLKFKETIVGLVDRNVLSYTEREQLSHAAPEGNQVEKLIFIFCGMERYGYNTFLEILDDTDQVTLSNYLRLKETQVIGRTSTEEILHTKKAEMMQIRNLKDILLDLELQGFKDYAHLKELRTKNLHSIFLEAIKEDSDEAYACLIKSLFRRGQGNIALTLNPLKFKPHDEIMYYLDIHKTVLQGARLKTDVDMKLNDLNEKYNKFENARNHITKELNDLRQMHKSQDNKFSKSYQDLLDMYKKQEKKSRSNHEDHRQMYAGEKEKNEIKCNDMKNVCRAQGQRLVGYIWLEIFVIGFFGAIAVAVFLNLFSSDLQDNVKLKDHMLDVQTKLAELDSYITIPSLSPFPHLHLNLDYSTPKRNFEIKKVTFIHILPEDEVLLVNSRTEGDSLLKLFYKLDWEVRKSRFFPSKVTALTVFRDVAIIGCENGKVIKLSWQDFRIVAEWNADKSIPLGSRILEGGYIFFPADTEGEIKIHTYKHMRSGILDQDPGFINTLPKSQMLGRLVTDGTGSSAVSVGKNHKLSTFYDDSYEFHDANRIALDKVSDAVPYLAQKTTHRTIIVALRYVTGDTEIVEYKIRNQSGVKLHTLFPKGSEVITFSFRMPYLWVIHRKGDQEFAQLFKPYEG